MRNYWTWYLPITFLAFAIPEGIALATGRPQNTLSEYIWHTFGVIRNQPIQDWSAAHFLFAGILGVIAAWTVLHLTLGILR